MSNKNLWTIIAVVFVVLVIAGVWYWQSQQPAEDGLTGEEQNIQNLQRSLEEATAAPTVEIPSANPLDAALPDVNPAETANPFRTRNPFE